MIRRIAVVGALLALTATQIASACTGIRLSAKDGTVVVARTMEFGADLKSGVAVFPKGTAFTGTLPDGAKGATWTSKYGMIGANAFGLPVIVDGMNDQGLYVGEFFFPGYASYAPVTAANASKSMAGYEYSTWILANFSSIAEVKAAYDHVSLAPTVLAQLGMAPPVHFRIMDKTGASVVVEPLNGGLKIYDDPLGILTNSPTFDWHMTNLNNYIGLTPMIHETVKTAGTTLQGFGQGSGFFGLPGDFTPPSRFVRAVAYQQTAIQPATSADAVQQIFHILNNFDIPVGSVRDVVQGQQVDEWTLWTSAEDLKNLVFYFRTFTDQTLHGVDVKKALASAGTSIKYLPMESGATTPIVGVTP
jgi:choloylglycine hydrolase